MIERRRSHGERAGLRAFRLVPLSPEDGTAQQRRLSLWGRAIRLAVERA